MKMRKQCDDTACAGVVILIREQGAYSVGLVHEKHIDRGEQAPDADPNPCQECPGIVGGATDEDGVVCIRRQITHQHFGIADRITRDMGLEEVAGYLEGFFLRATSLWREAHIKVVTRGAPTSSTAGFSSINGAIHSNTVFFQSREALFGVVSLERQERTREDSNDGDDFDLSWFFHVF